MSDVPHALKSILLDDVSTPQRQEFAKMLAEACAMETLQSNGHRCWFYVLTPYECRKMEQFNQPPNNRNSCLPLSRKSIWQ